VVLSPLGTFNVSLVVSNRNVSKLVLHEDVSLSVMGRVFPNQMINVTGVLVDAIENFLLRAMLICQ
jgi:hypothetical protein